MVVCTICDENFEKNCYLEKHLESEHNQEKDFKCDACGKKFILQWRLEKHQLIHTSTVLKHCRYFLANKTCPFDEIGCKFLHKAKEETNAVKKIDISSNANQSQLESYDTCDNSQCDACIVKQWNSQW